MGSPSDTTKFPCRVRCINNDSFEGLFKIGDEFTATGIIHACGEPFLVLKENGEWRPDRFEIVAEAERGLES